MLHLTKGSTNTIYFTATELATISNPYFLFVFVCRSTNKKVKFVVTNQSTTARVDKGTIVTNDYFSTSDEGFHTYTIYQKATNTDTTESGVILEKGYMYLHPETEFASTFYTGQNNEFTTP